jgi:phosphoserine phosphatase RsbU/P
VAFSSTNRFASGLSGFWRTLTEGLSLQQLWDQFQRETLASYRLYETEVQGHVETLPRRNRGFHVVRALAGAMIRKLSPPRRLCLLAALAMLTFGFVFGLGLYSVAGVLALLALLGLELADRVAMKRDLQIAREIQTWLVPQAPPAVPGLDIAFTTRPANTVAGDYYDAFVPPRAGADQPDRLLLVVADVAGKSMPAALLMATFQSSLRTLAQEPLPLATLVARLNRYCCDHSLEGRRFTTAVVAQLDCATGELQFVNAGHNPPALRHPDGSVETLGAGGLPLGVQRDAAYESGRTVMRPADLLVIYTDGVVEAQDAARNEYGEERFMQWLRASQPAAAAEVLASLIASVDGFVGNAPRFDDVTCLVVRSGGDVSLPRP